MFATLRCTMNVGQEQIAQMTLETSQNSFKVKLKGDNKNQVYTCLTQLKSKNKGIFISERLINVWKTNKQCFKSTATSGIIKADGKN